MKKSLKALMEAAVELRITKKHFKEIITLLMENNILNESLIIDVDIGVKFLTEALVNEILIDYPRKEGRTRGVERMKRDIHSMEDFLALKQSIRNYRLKKIGTETQYLLLFSTFMNQWREWVDENTGTSDLETGLKSWLEQDD